MVVRDARPACGSYRYKKNVRLCIVVLKYDIAQKFVLGLGLVEQVDPRLPVGEIMSSSWEM